MNRHNGYTHTQRERKKNRYFVRAFFSFSRLDSRAFVALFLFTRQEKFLFSLVFLIPIFISACFASSFLSGQLFPLQIVLFKKKKIRRRRRRRKGAGGINKESSSSIPAE
jgi:hypothetical protein